MAVSNQLNDVPSHPDREPLESLGDLKAVLLQHGLALSVLLDLLVEHGLVSRDEIAQRAQDITRDLELPSTPETSTSGIS